MVKKPKPYLQKADYYPNDWFVCAPSGFELRIMLQGPVGLRIRLEKEGYFWGDVAKEQRSRKEADRDG